MSKKQDEPTLRLEWRTADELADHPSNWRRHPDRQTRALRDVIDEVGWAGVILANERTGHIIDGHARKKIARKGEKLPVLIGSWDEKDEAKILATLDPLAALAERDDVAWTALLADVETDSAALREMLELPELPELPFDDLPTKGKATAALVAKLALPPRVWLTAKDEVTHAVATVCDQYGITIEWPD